MLLLAMAKIRTGRVNFGVILWKIRGFMISVVMMVRIIGKEGNIRWLALMGLVLVLELIIDHIYIIYTIIYIYIIYIIYIVKISTNADKTSHRHPHNNPAVDNLLQSILTCISNIIPNNHSNVKIQKQSIGNADKPNINRWHNAPNILTHTIKISTIQCNIKMFLCSRTRSTW